MQSAKPFKIPESVLVVVHTAAMTNVDGCEREPEAAWDINAMGSMHVADACNLAGSRLVAVSTDYVFDGHNGPYAENARTHATSAYGRSKLAAEQTVAAACEEHYKPQGPNDRVPTDPVSIAVALADKLDTLVGFWAIDEKPTGSKDPYALRPEDLLGGVRVKLAEVLPSLSYAYLVYDVDPGHALVAAIEPVDEDV